MKRRLGWLWASAVALALGVSGLAMAAPQDIEDDPEFRFAVGLRDFGYSDFAEVVFKRLKAVKDYTRDQRGRILQESALNYVGWSDEEAYAKDKLARLEMAIAELEEVAKLRPDDEDGRLEHDERLAQALVEVGKTLTLVIRFPRGDLDAAKAAAATDRLFDQAVKSLKAAEGVYSRRIQDIEQKAKTADINDRDRALRQKAMDAKMNVENLLGWSCYEWAQVYEKSQPNRLQELIKQAEEIFTNIRGNTRYRGRFVVLPATVGQGVCRTARGDYSAAVQSFAYVLDAEDPSPEVQQVQDQAMFHKGRAEVLWGHFAEAEKSLTELIKSKPAKALEARARLELAKSQTKRAEILWQRAEVARKTAKEQDEYLEKLRKGEVKPPDPPPNEKAKSPKELQAEVRTNVARCRYEASDLEDQYQPIARNAFREVQEITRRGGWVAMEAAPLLPILRQIVGKEAVGALALYVEGQQLEKGQKFLEAIDMYRTAIRTAGSSAQDLEVRANCWAQLALCHRSLNELYEAGLCLAEFVRRHPQDERARNAAWWATILLGYAYKNAQQNTYVGQVYLDTQEVFVETFPDDPRGDKMAFRLADLRRGQGDLDGAIKYYRLIPEASPSYERAQYHAGDAHWRVFLKHVQAARQQGKPSPEAQARLDEAEKTLTRLVQWADTQPVPEGREDIIHARRVWTAESRVRLAEIYAYRLVGQPQKALDALATMAAYEPFLLKDKDRAATAWVAYMIRVRALLDLQKLAEAEKAAQELLSRNPRFEQNDEVCAALGLRYANMAKDKGVKPERETKEQETARKAEEQSLIQKAALWFMKALEVKPDQTAAVYERTARLLYGAGSYANAMDVANKLIDRFGKTAKDDAERQAVLDARILVAQSYARMEKWDEALGRLKALHQEAPNHLELRIDLAKALLAAKQYAEAAKLWREIAEGLRHGSESWFQARTALAQSMVRAGNKAAAYKNLLTVVVTWHPLPSPLYKTHFQQPVEELIQKEMGADYWKQYQEAIANLKAPAGATDADKF